MGGELPTRMAPPKKIKNMPKDGPRGFGVFAPNDDQGPEVRFSWYVPTPNNGFELWAALQAPQGAVVKPRIGRPGVGQRRLGP